MPSRRSHTNSHHGCKRCKQKKVKCDEGQPSCARCLSKGENCEYNQLVQRHFTVVNEKFTGTHKPASQTAGRKASASKQSATRLSTTRPSSKTALPPKSGSPANDMILSSATVNPMVRNSIEARIFDHFHTLGPFRETINAPQKSALSNARQGFSFFISAIKRNLPAHEFLRHGVYSFSALHLAMNEVGPGRQELVNAALNYEISALAAFQPHLHCITRDNCEAAILFSTVLCMCAFATPVSTGKIFGPNSRPDSGASDTNGAGSAGCPPSDPTPPASEALQQITRIIKLFRGTKAIADMALRCSPDHGLGEFWRRRALTAQEAPSPEADASLDRFEALLKTQDLSVELQEAYAWSVLTTRRCLRRSRAEPNVPYLVIMWAGMTRADFVAELDAQSPPALVILAHWAVTLHKISNHFWASGWGRWVILAVCHTLQDEEWRSLLYWPLQEIGVQPEEEGVFPLPLSADVIDPELTGSRSDDWGTQGIFWGPLKLPEMPLPLNRRGNESTPMAT